MQDNEREKHFNITVGEFNGSLEALLDLVQKHKMDIGDVSLAQVADEYIAHVQSLQSWPNIESVHFIVTAATLLLIKSKSLLPNLELTTDEEEDIKGLEERLQLYSIYQHARDVLAQYLKNTMPLYAPKNIKIKRIVFAPAHYLALGALSSAMQDVLRKLPNIDTKPKAEITETVNIEEVMQGLLKRVDSAVGKSFKKVSGSDRGEILINFLALLELVKDGVLIAQQDNTYEDIVMSSSEH